VFRSPPQATRETPNERIAGLARELGVGISFHTPGDNISLFTDFPEANFFCGFIK